MSDCHLPLTLIDGNAIARRAFFLGLLLRSTLSQTPCDHDQLKQWKVARTKDATRLSEALNCSGGLFTVTWTGHVILEQTILVQWDTTLIVTGDKDSSAVADGNGSSRVFSVQEGSALEISNLHIINGYTKVESGAAVQVFLGKFTWMGYVLFRNNFSAVDGGAIGCHNCTLKGEGKAIFANNTAGNNGGAIQIVHGTMSTTAYTNFIDNRAGQGGGAMFATKETLVDFSESTIAKENSAMFGGAFAVDGHGDTNLRWRGSTTIEGNSAELVGGGLWVGDRCAVSWQDTMTFFRNTAERDGGGVAIAGNSALSGKGSTVFRENAATGSGGAVYSQGWEVQQTYVNAVFESNTAAVGGESFKSLSSVVWYCVRLNYLLQLFFASGLSTQHLLANQVMGPIPVHILLPRCHSNTCHRSGI